MLVRIVKRTFSGAEYCPEQKVLKLGGEGSTGVETLEFELPEGKALMQKWGVDARYAGVGHCILGYAAQEPAPAKPRKADFIVRVDRNR